MKFDLEERLVGFASEVITVVGCIPKNISGTHIAKQLSRSGTSPAANYGEAQAAESRADFVHKMKVALKELRETLIWLKILVRANLIKLESINSLIQECNELISIFVKSIETTKKNMKSE